MRALIIAAYALLLGESAAAQVIAAQRAIRANTVIAPADVTLLPGSIEGGADALDEVIGRETRVTIYPGHPIRLENLAPPAIVERNSIVEMRFRSGPLMITTEGRVLRRGREGEWIPVLNLTSKTTVQARVTRNGWVEVHQ